MKSACVCVCVTKLRVKELLCVTELCVCDNVVSCACEERAVKSRRRRSTRRSGRGCTTEKQEPRNDVRNYGKDIFRMASCSSWLGNVYLIEMFIVHISYF